MDSPKPGSFGWNELVTTNVAAAEKFFNGWSGGPGPFFGHDADHTRFLKRESPTGGIFKLT